VESEVEGEIERAEAEALESRRLHMPEPGSALVGVYAGHTASERSTE
jgi:hypothetical protein